MQDSLSSERIGAAKILVDVVLKKISVLEALKKLPKNSSDESVNTCFHILVHFEADEDIRKTDSLYREVQDDFILEAAETLAKGAPLPYNIIEEYKNFYQNDLISKTPTKENILKKMKRMINL